MPQQYPTYRPGDIANGHQWTGARWAEVAMFRAVPPGSSTSPAPKTSWYRKPWAVVLACTLGAGVLFGAGEPQTEEARAPQQQETTR